MKKQTFTDVKRNNSSAIRFTTKCLFDALILLLERKDFGKITISEICLLSGVARSTFYHNFSDKIDIITTYFIEHAAGAFSVGEQTPEGYLMLVDRGLQFCENHKKALMTLVKTDNALIWRALFETVSSISEGYFAPMLHYIGFDNRLELSAYLAAFFALEMAWIKSGMKEDRTEVMQSFCKVVNHNWHLDDKLLQPTAYAQQGNGTNIDSPVGH